MSDLFEEITTRFTTTMPRAGESLGLCRNASYRAAKRGDIKTIRIGGRLVVPCAWLREQLGIDKTGAR